MVQVFIPVYDSISAVVLDGPEIYQIGQERGVAESGEFEVFPRRDIDDGSAGDFMTGDIVNLKLKAHKSAAGQDEQKNKEHRTQVPGLKKVYFHYSQIKSLLRKISIASTSIKRV